MTKIPSLRSKLRPRFSPAAFTPRFSFSARLGIQESLTGRIGLLQLHPLTLAELHRKPFGRLEVFPTKKRPRFDIAAFSLGMENGGLPFPCFLRDSAAISLYWSAWLETTVYREIARFFARSNAHRVTLAILSKLKEAALQGECLSASMIPRIQSRRLNSRLEWRADPQVIATSSLRGLGWQQRALAGAMKKLGQSRGIIAPPIDRPILEKTDISISPWSSWS